MKKRMAEHFRYWKYRISEFLRYNRLWHYFGMPNSIWRKARKTFVKPKRVFYKWYKDENMPYIRDFISGGTSDTFISLNDFAWKTKWGTYRFEWLPFVKINFFGWRFLWVWEAPIGDNTEYYETIMNYLWMYNKDIAKTKQNFGWQKQDSEGNWVSDWDDSILK